MSDVTISLPPPPVPKPSSPTSTALPARPRPPVSPITKPLPPPIVTLSSKDKQRVNRVRQRLSPPALPPPAPPATISPSPPPYSSISPPPSSLLPSASQTPAPTERTPPPRPPPPATAPPSAPPTSSAVVTPPSIPIPSAPPRPRTPESSPPPPHATAPPTHEGEVVTVNGRADDVRGAPMASVEGERERVGGGGGEEQEERYERAPISIAAAGTKLEGGGRSDSGPEYENVDSLEEDEEEEEEEREGEEGEVEEGPDEERAGQSNRHSVVRQNYENWDFLGHSDSQESDDDDDNNYTPRPTLDCHRHHKPTQSNPPTLPLNTHPILMAKMSGGGAKGKGGKRRNRAPPPPPGGRKGVGRLERDVGKKRRGEREEGRERRRGEGKEGRREEGRREEGRERRRGEGRREEGREGRREEGREMRREGRREEGRRERKGNKETREEVAEERTRVEDGENREEDEGTEHDYSTIQRSDYINWEYEQESGSESDETTPTPRPHTTRPSNPPTLPLNTHPVLMRSHSQGDMVDSTDESSGKRPRNRAPPPPPSKTNSKPPRGFAHQLSHQPLSVPLPSLSQSQSSSNHSHVMDAGTRVEGTEYARVIKPPPAYKRTKSDQKPAGEESSSSDKRPGSPRERDRGKKSTVLGGAASSSPYQSPLALRKHGETPGHLDVRAGGGGGGGKGSGYGSGGEGVTRGGGRVGEGGGAPPSRPPPRAPGAAGGGKRKRWSAAEVEGERRGRDKESPLLSNLKKKESSAVPEPLSRPKRQAPPPPPPPAGRVTAVDLDHSERESPQGAEAPSDRLTGETGRADSHLQTPPPKPKRLHRRTPPVPAEAAAVVLATDASPTTQESTETEGRSQTSSGGTPRTENGQTGGMDRWERLLHKMEFFTIDLIKAGDRSLGMVIVSGKVRNKDGSTVEGIFIQKILPGSLTDKDGRIQAGDMLVEINTVSMVGAVVETASRKLRDSKDSVKLKVGRPDRGAFKVPGEGSSEPIYVNSDDMEDSELQEKLERAEARAEKMEELKEEAEEDLISIRELADKEQKSFHKKLEEAEAERAAYKKDTQAKITDLTIALANITVDKTKLEKEVEALRLSNTRSSGGQQQDEELSRLKRELKEAESERDMAERHLKELRQEVEGGGGLQSRLAELESELVQVREERAASQRQLESTCHELTVAHATLEQMQIEKTEMKEENERLSEELERVRRPSAGRAGAEAELALKRKELSSLQREVQTVREERERGEREAGETRRELEKEREKVSDLENKLDSQTRAEKAATYELLSRIETQEQEIRDLKKELLEARAQGSALAVTPVVGVVKTGSVIEEKEEGMSGDRERLGGLAAGVKQRSLDSEASPPQKRDQSPRMGASSSANKESPVKSGSPAKEGSKSPKPLKDKPHDDSFSIEAFDTIKPLEMLDNTHAKDKTQVALRNAKRVRNKPSREHIRSMSAENLLSNVELPSTADSSSSPTEKLPVPRPRKATLEKDSPVHKPLPVPRHLRSPIPPQSEATPPQRPPKPDSGPGSPDRKARGTGRVSPPRTRAPSPKPLLPPTTPVKNSALPPKPAPRRPHRQGDDPVIEDNPPAKDPSQLTIKERMELAHKAMKKPPPVAPKKPVTNRLGVVESDLGPKSLSQPDGDDGSEIPGTRYSDITHTPRPVRKLPPGAVGLFPMAPFGASPRHRSNTATAGSSREQSQDREIANDKNADRGENGTDSGSREALDLNDVEVKFPPKRPPLPLNRRTASNEKPAQLSSKNDELPTESVPPPVAPTEGGREESEVKVHEEYGTLPDPATLDPSQVLSWSPVQVAAWVTHVGVGQYAKGFLDKGVQGNKLFDIDSSELKAMGVSSADDRAIFKREIKTLRQHAERQRKLLEKQRKDEKKKKKRQFV